MSTDAENPTLQCPPTAVGACPPPLVAAASPAAKEGPRNAGPQPPKSALLPEIARLSLTGHSGRAIGKRLHVPETVEAAAEPAPGAEYLGASLAESGYTPV